MKIRRMFNSAPNIIGQSKMMPLATPWTRQAELDDVLGGHPHPQFQRDEWMSLDGPWSYRIVELGIAAATAWRDAPAPDDMDGQIRVPFSPEAPLSGVNRQLQPSELLWYRRTVAAPSVQQDQRCLLHFEAVDYACRCLVNGVTVGQHVGGYTPFCFDVTDVLQQGQNTIELCVFDPSEAGEQPRGKQRLDHSTIWYSAQSGIWQPVWMEVVPQRRLDHVLVQPDLDTGQVAVAAEVTQPGGQLLVQVFDHQDTLVAQQSIQADDTMPVVIPVVTDPHMWSPDDPYLYRLELRYDDDVVHSYCAFRSVYVAPDDQGRRRFFLNHQPLFLRGVLDQGYWPDGLMTAPGDAALEFDILKAKQMGFNMIRMHIKVECDRWYWMCDKLGMLVWQDMVSGGGAEYKPWYVRNIPSIWKSAWNWYSDDTPEHHENLSAGNERFRREWTQCCVETVTNLRNHPCIVTWVLFNEGWGQFNAQDAVEMVRSLDGTRPIDAASGWYDQQCGDYISIHNYFHPLEVYPSAAKIKRAFVISEFGGLGWHVDGHSSYRLAYGYENFPDVESWRKGVNEQLRQAIELEEQGLAGFVYTQLSDVEEESNGLLTYDRRVDKTRD